MDDSEDNLSADDTRVGHTLSSAKSKQKKRSLVERELETNLTAHVTSPVTIREACNTSRYGRALRIKKDSDFMDTERLLSKSTILPTIEKTPEAVQSSPVNKMHASNSPIKSERGKLDKVLSTSDSQIENIYSENISLSRFSSSEKKKSLSSTSLPKVYVRKDLIQSSQDDNIRLPKNMLSPSSTKKPTNSHLKNILERSSEKYNLNNTGKKSINSNVYMNTSSVVKTLDFDGHKRGNNNKIVLSKSDLFELERWCEYQVGDLAWARMGTYPFWPCIVTREPSTGMFVKKKLFGRIERDIIHVTFFGDNGRRSWILDSMLRKFLGQLEFEATREHFCSSAKKTDSKLYAAFFISEKKMPQWSVSVEEAETLLREPKRLRVEIFNDMLVKSRSMKIMKVKSGKITRTNSNVSLSESLYDTLFSENGSNFEDLDGSRSKTRQSLDVSEVVTACLDNMAAKSGITKIQKQSHMDIWLQKAKSKTPEKSQVKHQVPSKDKEKVSSSKKKKCESKQSLPVKMPYSLRNSYESQKSTCPANEYNYRNKIRNKSDVIPGITFGIITKVESLRGKVDNLQDMPDKSDTEENTINLCESPTFTQDYEDIHENQLNNSSICSEMHESIQDDSEKYKENMIEDKVVNDIMNNGIDDTSEMKHILITSTFSIPSLDSSVDESNISSDALNNDNNKTSYNLSCSAQDRYSENNVNLDVDSQIRQNNSDVGLNRIENLALEFNIESHKETNNESQEEINNELHKEINTVKQNELSISNSQRRQKNADSSLNVIENLELNVNFESHKETSTTKESKLSNGKQVKPTNINISTHSIEKTDTDSSFDSSTQSLGDENTDRSFTKPRLRPRKSRKLSLKKRGISKISKAQDQDKDGFAKYVEIRQDALMDEYPHLSESEMMDYLSKTWQYQKGDEPNVEQHISNNNDTNEVISEKFETNIVNDVCEKPRKKVCTVSLTDILLQSNISVAFRNGKKTCVWPIVEESIKSNDLVYNDMVDKNKSNDNISKMFVPEINETSSSNVNNGQTRMKDQELTCNNVDDKLLCNKDSSEIFIKKCIESNKNGLNVEDNINAVILNDTRDSIENNKKESSFDTVSSEAVNYRKESDTLSKVTNENTILTDSQNIVQISEEVNKIGNLSKTVDVVVSNVLGNCDNSVLKPLNKSVSNSILNELLDVSDVTSVSITTEKDSESLEKLSNRETSISETKFEEKLKSLSGYTNEVILNNNLNVAQGCLHVANKMKNCNDNFDIIVSNNIEKDTRDISTITSISNNMVTKEDDEILKSVNKFSTKSQSLTILSSFKPLIDDLNNKEGNKVNIYDADDKVIPIVEDVAELTDRQNIDFDSNSTKVSKKLTTVIDEKTQSLTILSSSKPLNDDLNNKEDNKVTIYDDDDKVIPIVEDVAELTDRQIDFDSNSTKVSKKLSTVIDEKTLSLTILSSSKPLNDDLNNKEDNKVSIYDDDDKVIPIVEDVAELTDRQNIDFDSNSTKFSKILTSVIDEKNSTVSKICKTSIECLQDHVKLNGFHSSDDCTPEVSEGECNAETSSIYSEDSEPLSIIKSKLQLKTSYKVNDMNNPEFLKYVELRQDALMDEHSELSYEELLQYMYKTWLYEENSKSIFMKSDDIKQSGLVKGLDDNLRQKSIRNSFRERKKRKHQSGNEDTISVCSDISDDSVKRKLRKRTIKSIVDTIDNSQSGISKESSPERKNLETEEAETDSNNPDFTNKPIHSPNPDVICNIEMTMEEKQIEIPIEQGLLMGVKDSENSLPPSTITHKNYEPKKFFDIFNQTEKKHKISKMNLDKSDTDIEKDYDPETISIDSEDSEISQSKRKQRKNEKQLTKDDPEFLKYLELRQDALIDENPDLSQDEIVSYLFKTWLYEESGKSDIKKSDEMEQAHLIKGLSPDTPVLKKVQKKNKAEKEATHEMIDDITLKDKPKRKTSHPYYIEDDLSDSEDIDVFDIFKSKQKLSTGEIIDDIEDDIIDEVELYFKQLIQPKPNVFKGYVREKVCEICEKTGNLTRCKGCNSMFHVDCVKKEMEVKVEAPPPTRGRKKKKKLGRKPKNHLDESGSHSDEKSQDLSEENNVSVEDVTETESYIVDAEDFESILEVKMKELIPMAGDYYSYSNCEGINWNGTIVDKCEILETKLTPKTEINNSDFKCNKCKEHNIPVCFVCKLAVSKTGVEYRQRCQTAQCYKYFHVECLDHWPQTQFQGREISKTSNKVDGRFEEFMCPRHVCHTCVSDDPRGCKTRFSGDKLARCVRCPATYHSFSKCLPAGSQILTASHIICPRHYEHRPGKVPCHVNTGWCFICALGGSLICCEYCPTSFHAECLNIKPPEGGYMCEDCETGRLPLYGEMVWVKLGHYRWWPGLILHPSEIPDNIMAVKHSLGEFVVRFFGQYDYYWVNRGRVFPFQEGDSGRISSQRSKIDAAFTTAMEHAQRACEIMKTAVSNGEEDSDIASSLLPPHYVKLKVNKPVGAVCSRRADVQESSLTQCDCNPDVEDPCGPYSHCLNRMLLTECGPSCRAGDRCNNRAFEKRQYPRMAPYRTPQRGWGLRALEDIKAGQFVIEYVGELIDEEEFRKRMNRMHEVRDENFYFLTLDKERMIDAGPKGNLARFMNHCCEPNCETQKWTVLGDVRVGLFAIRDIPANSELTFNYNLECAGIEKKRCLCGAKRCSGYIGAKPKQDEQPKKPKRTYKKRKPTEESPSTSKSKPKRPVGRPAKPRELTEIEKDLLIIKNATNGLSSDSECSVRLSSVDSTQNAKALKRKRVSFSTEEPTGPTSSPNNTKRVKLDDKKLIEVGD